MVSWSRTDTLALFGFVAPAVGLFFLVMWAVPSDAWTAAPQLLFDYSGWIGMAFVALLLISIAIIQRVDIPFIRVATSAPWWQHIVFGLFGFYIITSAIVGMFGFIVLLGCVWPWKMVYLFMHDYKEQTLMSVIVAVPLVFACVGGLFAAMYGVGLTRLKGNLRQNGTLYNVPDLGKPSYEMPDLLYLSWCTMLGADSGYETLGVCRWIALMETLVAKLLEIVIIAVGLGIVVNRLAGAQPVKPQMTVEQIKSSVEAPAVIPPAT
jgi:hypothetical protein